MGDPILALCAHLDGSDLSLDEKQRLIDERISNLPQADADCLVDCLKDHADRRRFDGQTDAARALGMLIVRIGERRAWFSYQGIGFMVCGDAYNQDHQYELAWDALEKAGSLHKQAAAANEPDAQFNWARTLIGKWMCVQGRARIKQVTEESDEAESIFKTSAHPAALEKRLKLYNSIGIYLYEQVGPEKALPCYENILKTLRESGAAFPDLESIALLNRGNIRIHQGKAREAEADYRRSMPISEALGFHDNVVTARQGIANSLIQRGLYRDALRLLDDIIHRPETSRGAWAFAMRSRLQCLFELGYFQDAEIEASRLLASDRVDTHDTRWHALTVLAKAQAEQGMLQGACATIEQALELAQRGEMTRQEMLADLDYAQIALRRGDHTRARACAEKAVSYLESIGDNLATEGRLILAELAWHTLGDSVAVRGHCEAALRRGLAMNSPPLLYRANLLLGHVARGQGDVQEAEACYLRAVEAIDEAQRDLTIAYRPGFLSDKGEALCALIDLYLAQRRNAAAFELLERAREQTFSGYLARNGAHRWADDERSRVLETELDRLREDLVARSNAAQGQPPSDETKALQQHVRQVVRELYGLAVGAGRILAAPGTRDIQRRLPKDSAVIAFFDDGELVRALVLHPEGEPDAVACAPSATVRALQHDLARATSFALGALKLVEPSAATCEAESILRHPALNHPTQRQTFEAAANRLYESLLRPFAAAIEHCTRLYIMPHRALHLVPFHLLFDGEKYLIARREIVILPSAHPLVQPTTPYPPGALTVYDNQNRALRCSEHDARAIHAVLRGQCMAADSKEVLTLLRNNGGQILHLIAHAKFEPDSPETAFIQFGDRQFYLSDLMQQELHFRLVTLTACETGRAQLIEQTRRVAHGDDLIGIGRAFLYAGAQAILSSQWALGDGLTLPLLTRFYKALQEGATVPAAFQAAQIGMMKDYLTLHPVFWGAFQLVGATDP